jgi:hypothetical protein
VLTCYKAIRREAMAAVLPSLRERGFGSEVELTARLARLPGIRFYERAIGYAPRSFAEGKKIHWRDGLWALWCAARYGLANHGVPRHE